MPPLIDPKQDAQKPLEVPPQPVMDDAPLDPPQRVVADQVDDAPDAPPAPRPESKRDAILARYRKQRVPTEEDDDAAEIRAFANNGMPPELSEPRSRQQPVEEPPEPQRPAPAEKHRIKVRGEEKDLTLDELKAMAQKNDAADQYFEESRQALERAAARDRESEERARRVEAILQQHESGQRPAPTAQHQGDQNGATEGDGVQDDPFTKLTKDIVYGEPEEAGRNLRSTVEDTAQRATRQVLDSERQRDEIARNRKFVADFKSQHPDIDDFVEAGITDHLMTQQYDDLVKLAPKLGLKPEQLPTDLAGISNWHLFYRSKGEQVKSVEAMTTDAYNNFVEWETKRGRVQTPPAGQEDPAATPKPQQVVVDLDRDARRDRRLNIPQQPTRVSAPQAIQQEAPTSPNRSAVAQNMIRARAAKRGRVVA